MGEIIQSIVDNGISVVVVAYFIVKDYKFNTTLVQTLQSIRDYMDKQQSNNKRG